MYGGPERLVPHFGPRPRRSFASIAFHSVIRNRWLLAFLIIALVVNGTLWLFLGLRYAGLNELLPLHFDAQGLPDRIESKDAIFALPTIGLVVLLLNGGLAFLAQTRERAAGILLSASALLVEVLLWVAAFNIVGGIS